MRKFGIVLAALIMLLGFASCDSDGGNGDNGGKGAVLFDSEIRGSIWEGEGSNYLHINTTGNGGYYILGSNFPFTLVSISEGGVHNITSQGFSGTITISGNSLTLRHSGEDHLFTREGS